MNDVIVSRLSIGRFLRRYLAGISLTLVGVGFGAGGWFIPTKPKEAYLKIICCSLILLAGLFGVVWTLWRFLREPEWVEVGPDGVRWQGGGKEKQIAWGDITEVYRQEKHVLVNNAKPSEWNRQSFVRLMLADQSRVEFHVSLTNYDALADAIMERSFKPLVASRVAELKSTGRALFGPVIVSPEGLSIKGKLRTWSEINYGANRGHLVVAPNVEDFRYQDITEIPLADIPNYLAALVMMEQVGKPASAAGEFYPKEMRPHMMKRG